MLKANCMATYVLTLKSGETVKVEAETVRSMRSEALGMKIGACFYDADDNEVAAFHPEHIQGYVKRENSVD